MDGWFDAGFNTIDTADVYSSWAPGNKGGEAETIIGKWLKQSGRKREDVVIVTKVGSDMGNGNKGLKSGWINKAVEDSLRRLQTDTSISTSRTGRTRRHLTKRRLPPSTG